ncbi:MAG: universal stress protein [Arenicellales bacterium]|nr:universal stress protein [Arenicellales bacterium]
MYKNILCAIDGSEHSLRAATQACEIAKQSGGSLTFIVVTKPFKISSEAKQYLERESLLGEATYIVAPMTEKVLDEAKRSAKNAEIKDVKTVIREGQAARKIVEYAKLEKCDVIVMGSRGRGDVESFLLGSVAHKVSSLAPCTVMLVK